MQVKRKCWNLFYLREEKRCLRCQHPLKARGSDETISPDGNSWAQGQIPFPVVQYLWSTETPHWGASPSNERSPAWTGPMDLASDLGKADTESSIPKTRREVRRLWLKPQKHITFWNRLSGVHFPKHKSTMVAISVVTNIVQWFWVSRNHSSNEHLKTVLQCYVINVSMYNVLSICKLLLFFCTVWSTLVRISLTKALVLWWCDNKSDLIWFD